MNVLDYINKLFRIDVFDKKSSEKDIDDLLLYSSISVPYEFLAIIRERTEIEILVDKRKYVRIWGARGCIDMNEAYHIQKYIPNSLAIGDDECGNTLIYAYGKNDFGVYIVAFNDLDVNELVYISGSLKEFFVDGIGVEVFNGVW